MNTIILYEKFSDIVTSSFHGDSQFAECVDRAFRQILNQSNAHAPLHFVRITDQILRKSSALNMDGAAREKRLDDIVWSCSSVLIN